MPRDEARRERLLPFRRAQAELRPVSRRIARGAFQRIPSRSASKKSGSVDPLWPPSSLRLLPAGAALQLVAQVRWRAFDGQSVRHRVPENTLA